MFRYVSFEKVSDAFTTHTFRSTDEAVKVHSFSVNVVSLEADNNDDISALIAAQSPLIKCVEITKDVFVEAIKTSLQYARIKEVLEQKYNEEVNVLAAQYPNVERETWGTQLAQAKAFKINGNEVDAPFLKTLADAEGGTVDDFANAVIAKAEAYASFMAQMLARKRAHEKELLLEIGI